MRSQDEWSAVVDLIERVVGDDELLPSVTAGVRTLVREVAVLPSADVLGHTRAMLFAATRALADRRGPTEAELAFVEELAVTRARQGVPVEAVLGAIHVAERAIWARAREVAAATGVAPDLLLDARELYDDWAEAMRSRLITAHRATGSGPGPRADDREATLLRRLLEGGSAAALAAAEAGLPTTGGLWLLATRSTTPTPTPLERALRAHPPALSAPLNGFLFSILPHPPPPHLQSAPLPTNSIPPGTTAPKPRPRPLGSSSPGVAVPGPRPGSSGGSSPGVAVPQPRPGSSGGSSPGVAVPESRSRLSGGSSPGVAVPQPRPRSSGGSSQRAVTGLAVPESRPRPADGSSPGVAAGLAGPVEPEELAAARRLALTALAAAEATGRTGVVHVADTVTVASLVDRADLAEVLLDHHRKSWHALGPNAAPIAQAVRAWLEADQDVNTAAKRLFVHANTIRNRVQRFTTITGIDPTTTFGAVDAWWLCHNWLTHP